jgi:DNA polymerase-4
MVDFMGRVIFLVDMNAFFISCEMARNHQLKGKPAAVAGNPKNRHGIILAANYDARKYGIKTTMLIHEARKLYPELTLVPPDHKLYDMKSREVMNILGRYSPVIQQNSIDEAWMDLTGCEALFGQPLEIARNIMKDIINELDLWCSIGISDNKFLAKMASDLKKPLGITEVWQKDVKEKIWQLPVREMYGIGKQTEKRLTDIGLYTIGDIARCDRAVLARLFGKYGEELGRLANGIDLSPVTEHPEHDSKSITRSTTLSSDTLDMEYCKSVLLRLAEEVGAEARKFYYKGKTVSIVIKYGDFQSITRQKSVPPTCLTREIYRTGISLLKDNWNRSKPVRLLGIGLGNVADDYLEQVSIFDFADNEKSNVKEEKLERTIDSIRERFGHDKVKRAKVIEGLGKGSIKGSSK